ncbi:MAG: 16S rRNA (uracil(1498)-N(3))-methyltransferase [Verrucomicrobia bacterium]|nr:16S rRNA (uracil(1498)-N(3))-methyltransferase [Verrucomicrobiota bacterium]
MNLILVEPDERRADGTLRLSGPRARHIADVLKAQPGDSIRLGVLDGPLGTGTITSLTKEAIELSCALEDRIPPRPRVDLLLALPRPKIMRRLWAPLAALGVGRIFLTNAWKVERMYFDSHAVRPEVYRPLLIEGLQQARDTRLPEVRVFKQFKVLVEDELPGLFPEGLRLMARPAAGKAIQAAISEVHPARVLLAVGPEGGWIPYEEDLLMRHGFQPVSMGPRTLRADTACVALLALLNEEMRGAALDHS